MKQVVVVPTIRKEQDIAYTKLAIETLQKCGATVSMGTQYSGLFSVEAVRFADADVLYSGAELLVVLGGDGSILRAAQVALQYDIPLVGINLGRLGYMAELEKSETSLLEKIYTDKYAIEKRMTLSVGLRTADGVYTELGTALNDVVVGRMAYAHSIDLLLLANGKAVRTVRSDGMIVSTPTGSTAYSMSAGGSVVDPMLECLCVTPICPLSRYACPIVFSGESVIEIRSIDDRIDACNISLDGEGGIPLRQGDTLVVRRSQKNVKMLSVKDEGFFETLNNKISKYELKS